ncbi:MAG: tetraacyldisaccharide 4'-kinase [Phycisphaerae bacterium]
MEANRSTGQPGTTPDRRQVWLPLISGEQRGLGAALARFGLWLMAGLYHAGLFLRNLRFRLPGAVRRIGRPVISVGNLTVGGTGKTPMAAYLARLAAKMGGRPLVISRGYASAAGEANEETRELARLCPDIPCVQNQDRWQAIHDWMWRNPCDIAILDDGFQHRRLARDLDIVLVDASLPFGYGHVLPRGLLREPPSALRRADLVVITRAELVEADALAALKEDLARRTRPGVPILVAEHRPQELIALDGSSQNLSRLRGQDVAAACGIGNPDAFRRTLEALDARVALWETYPDHYPYTVEEIERLLRAAHSAGLKMLVTSGKDYVKWKPLLGGRKGSGSAPVEVVALTVGIEIVEGADVLARRVRSLLPG